MAGDEADRVDCLDIVKMYTLYVGDRQTQRGGCQRGRGANFKEEIGVTALE